MTMSEHFNQNLKLKIILRFLFSFIGLNWVTRRILMLRIVGE